ncbi:hypothetical protein ACWD7T_10800 [Streptomyces sp. 900116325]
MTERHNTELHHLLSRAIDGVVLHGESDRLRELVRELEADLARVQGHACRVAEKLRKAERAVDQTEAYPTETSWIAEVQESDDQWMYLRADCDRAVVEQRIASMQKRFPQWKDGTPVNGRIIRKTTTYTVEPAADREPLTHLAKGANAEDCPACKGTNPPYPFLCPGPEQQPTV